MLEENFKNLFVKIVNDLKEEKNKKVDCIQYMQIKFSNIEEKWRKGIQIWKNKNFKK